MSSIVSSTSSTSVPLTTTVQPSSQAASSSPSAGVGATSTAPPALYQSFGAAFGTGLLGLRNPSNPEDAAIILAQISLAVDAAAREGSDNKLKGVLGGLSAGFGAALAALTASSGQIAAKTVEKAAAQSDLTTATQQQTQLTTQRSTLTAQIGQLNADIATKTDQKTSAESEKTTLVGQQQTLTGSIATLTAQIGQLDADIAAARAAGQDARVTELTATRQAAVDSRETQRGSLAAVNVRIADKTAEIADLTSEITADRADLVTATASLADVETKLQTVATTIATAQTTIARLDTEIAALDQASRNAGLAVVAVFSQLAVALQTGGGDKAISENRDTQFDLLLEDVVKNLKAFQQSQIDEVKDQARVTGEVSMQVDERRVAQIALGLVAGIADVLRTLASLGAPSASPGDAVRGFDQPYRLAI